MLTVFAELKSAIWRPSNFTRLCTVKRPPTVGTRTMLRSYDLSLIDLQREITIIQNGSDRNGGLLSSLSFPSRSDPQSEN